MTANVIARSGVGLLSEVCPWGAHLETAGTHSDVQKKRVSPLSCLRKSPMCTEWLISRAELLRRGRRYCGDVIPRRAAERGMTMEFCHGSGHYQVPADGPLHVHGN